MGTFANAYRVAACAIVGPLGGRHALDRAVAQIGHARWWPTKSPLQQRGLCLAARARFLEAGDETPGAREGRHRRIRGRRPKRGRSHADVSDAVGHPDGGVARTKSRCGKTPRRAWDMAFYARSVPSGGPRNPPRGADVTCRDYIAFLQWKASNRDEST